MKTFRTGGRFGRTAAAGLLALGAALAVTVSDARAQTVAAATLADSTVAPTDSLQLSGTNWLHPTNGGSTIAIKIDAGAYSWTPADAVHVNLTIWTLVQVDASGSFSVPIDLPTTITEGEHVLNLLTGSLKPGDLTRSVTVPFTVTTDEEPPEEPEPVPVTATLAGTSTTPGGTLALSGAGWVHPTDGGSAIAVKIDDGAFSPPAGSSGHPDPTVWQVIQADASGAFTVDVVLPADIPAGAHWLRLLSGATKPGDVARSIPVEFTVVPGEEPEEPGEPADSATTQIIAEVTSTGGLTINVAAPSVALSEPVLTGGALLSGGDLPAVTVIDLRSGDPGWNVTGQVTDFTSDDDTIDADQLGWDPAVATTSSGQTVVAGPVAAPGSGLGTARQLAAAAAGAGRGTAVLGADLLLEIPTDAEPGTYGADLTLTVI